MSQSVSTSRKGGDELQLLKLGAYLLDAQTLEFLAPGGRSICCTRLEYKVLSALMMARGRPLHIDRLMGKVYADGEDEPSPACLRVVISKIRKKMRLAGIEDPIHCENGVGYRMTAGEDEIEVLVLDRKRLLALDAVLSFASKMMPDAVALIRKAA